MKKILFFALALLPAVAVMGQGNVSLMKVTMKSGTINDYDMSLINELSFEELSFKDNYKAFPLTIDPTKAYSPDDADASHGCVSGFGQGTEEAAHDGYHMEGLFSSDVNRFFHGCYFEVHHYDETYNSYVDFELPKEVTNLALEIAPRGGTSTGTMPKHVKVYAQNGEEWVLLGEVEGLDGKYNSETQYAPIGVFNAPFKISKVRFSVVQGYGQVLSGDMYTNKGYWTAGHLAVYGL